MSYQKPTVTVRQVQTTQSLPLPSPNFESCIVGQGYYWQNPFRDDAEVSSIAAAAYNGAIQTVSISEFTDHPAAGIVEGSIIVDLIRTKGPNGTVGDVEPLTNGVDFTYSLGDISISADVGSFVTGSGDEAKVRVGFLIKRPDLDGKFAKIVEAQEIIDLIGEPQPFNPLAFGASLAMGASGRSTNVLGADPANLAPATIKLESQDVYAISVLTGVRAEAELFSAHVTQMALPENKKERIAFASPDVVYTNETDDNTTEAANADKNTTAEAVKETAAALGNKRFFQVRPDMGWVESEVHISTLRSGFISAVYAMDLKPKLTANATINGTRYRAYDDITDAVLDGLEADGKIKIRAYYPVPGYIFTAALVGQVSAKEPAAPLTNSGVPGIAMLNRSNGYFSPTQLNTIASGGNWVLEQRAVGAIVNRHQMSTDAVTIETRELSITTQVDYAANFFRDLVSPLIGTKVISDSFINQLTALMKGVAQDLVEDKHVRDLQVQSVYQDDLEPDTIKADILLLPLYPLNYIKITLEF